MTAPDVPALLAALGDTPDAVAAALRAGGYRGRRCSPGSCPVSRYLTTRSGLFVTVSQSCAIGDRTSEHPSGPRWPTPPGVAQFITAFDRRAYPDLVEVPADVV